MDPTSVISDWVSFHQLQFNLPVMFQLHPSRHSVHRYLQTPTILPVLHHPDGLLPSIFALPHSLLRQILPFFSVSHSSDSAFLTHFTRQNLVLVTMSHPRFFNPNVSTSQMISSSPVSGCDHGLITYAGPQGHISLLGKDQDSSQWTSGLSTSLLNITLCSASPCAI